MSIKDEEILKKRILEEEDFIYCPRLGNSLSRLLEKNANGVNDERIKKVLLISQDEIHLWYNNAIEKLRKALKIEE